MSTVSKHKSRFLRKQRIRAQVAGDSGRPRLSVSVSNQHISAQLIDDSKQITLASASTIGDKEAAGTMTEKAAIVGARLAKNAKKAKVNKVVFDRNGRQYAKRLHAFAEAARKEGLEF